MELNLGALIAGTKYRGEFEERMQSLIKEVEADRNIVLVIDEFHALMNTGKVEGGGPDAVSILKPSLARGDITCIGITCQVSGHRELFYLGKVPRHRELFVGFGI